MSVLPQAPRLEAPHALRRGTHRGVRWLIFLGLMGILLLRVPQTQAMLQEKLPLEAPADMEPELLQLSVSVALLLGIIAFGIVLALYLGLAGVLEQNLFGGTRHLGRRVHIGLFTAIVVATLVPLQLWSFFSGSMPGTAVKALPVLVLCAAVLLLYRRSLAKVGLRRAVLVSAVAVALGAAVSIV
ncbi:hypothetical protein VUN84_01830 [Micrococcaceae bacterium Sec5.8]